MFTALTFSATAHASDGDESEGSDVSFGVGLGMITSSSGLLGLSPYLFSSPSIQVPIRFGDGFRLEPGLSASWGSSERSYTVSPNQETTYRSVSTSLGAYFTGSTEPVNLIVGPRVVYLNNLYETGGDYSHRFDSHELGIGCVVGLEFWVAESLAIGGEAYLGYAYSWMGDLENANTTEEDDELVDGEGHSLGTSGGLFLRWFI